MAGGQEKSAAPSYVITAGAFLPGFDRHRNKTQPEERKEGKGRLGTRLTVVLGCSCRCAAVASYTGGGAFYLCGHVSECSVVSKIKTRRTLLHALVNERFFASKAAFFTFQLFTLHSLEAVLLWVIATD